MRLMKLPGLGGETRNLQEPGSAQGSLFFKIKASDCTKRLRTFPTDLMDPNPACFSFLNLILDKKKHFLTC